MTVTSFSDTKVPRVSPQCASIGPPSPPSRSSRALIYFCINLFLFYLPGGNPGCRRLRRSRAATRPDATSTVNRKPCGIAASGAILSRMRVSTCTRRSYARRSKYGNAFTRNVFTGLSRNIKSARARGFPNGSQTRLIVLDGERRLALVVATRRLRRRVYIARSLARSVYREKLHFAKAFRNRVT